MARSVATVAAVAVTAAMLPFVAHASSATTEVVGAVFVDLDGDGVRDPGEEGLADVPVTLRTDAAVVDAVRTRQGGGFTFPAVPPATYEVAVEPPAGWVVTSGDATTAVTTTTGTTDAGETGLGAGVEGVDVAVRARLAGAPTTGEAGWSVHVHALGDGTLDDTVRVRLSLTGEHELVRAGGPAWVCDLDVTVASCRSTATASVPSSLPPLTATSSVLGTPGSTVTVEAALLGTVDGEPRNDRAAATATVGGGLAAVDGDVVAAGGDPALSETGGAVSAPLLAALGVLLLGGTVLGAARRR